MDLDLLPLRPNSEEPQVGQKLRFFVLRCDASNLQRVDRKNGEGVEDRAVMLAAIRRRVPRRAECLHGCDAGSSIGPFGRG